MLGSSGAPAELASPGAAGYVDVEKRHATNVAMSAPSQAIVDCVFAAHRDAVAAFFARPLAPAGPADFLRYPTGGLFTPHRDRRDDGDEELRTRVVTAIIVLNDRGSGRQQYSGGDLRVYGVVDDAAWRDIGLVVPAAPGDLIAFRADVLHEVTPVTAGVRCSAVTWFYD